MENDWETLIEHGSYETVDGIETHLYDIGSGDPLVLIHGGGWTSCAEMNWGANLLPLGERTRVIAPDLPGFGFTPIRDEDDYVSKNRAEFVITFLEELDLEGVTIAGNSMGGYVAAYAALSRPDLVDKAIIVNSGSASRKKPPEEPSGELNAPGPSREVIKEWFEWKPEENYIRPEFHPFWGSEATPEKIDRLHEIMERNHDHNQKRADRYRTERNISEYQGKHIFDSASEIDVPTLLTWSTTPEVFPAVHYKTGDWKEKQAELDEYFEQSDEEPWESGIKLFHEIPDAEIHMWQQAKHHIMTDKAPRWNDVVVDFHQTDATE